MLKKIDRAAAFIQEEARLFRCPMCHQPFENKKKSLICSHNHRFDLSKKGTFYFLKHQIQTDYNQSMFQHRRNLITNGVYQPLLERLAPYCDGQRILDVGCGEGSFLDQLRQQTNILPSVGFDISKEGIYLASDYVEDLFWCVADLTNLPFQDESFTTVLNIFSPSNYQEFKRVLKPGGKVVKIVPGSEYLKELRQAFYPEDENKQHYSNDLVIDKFQENFTKVVTEKVKYTFAIPENCRLSLLEMSPLEWGVSAETKEAVQKNPLKEITIDLDVLIGEYI